MKKWQENFYMNFIKSHTNRNDVDFTIYKQSRNSSATMSISAQGTANACEIAFYGCVYDGDVFVPIKACKVSDLTKMCEILPLL